VKIGGVQAELFGGFGIAAARRFNGLDDDRLLCFLLAPLREIYKAIGRFTQRRRETRKAPRQNRLSSAESGEPRKPEGGFGK